MKFTKRKLLCMGLAAFMTLIASCGGGGGGGGTGAVGLPGDLDPNSNSTETGTVTILATDLDTDQFSAINLTITRAELLGDGSRELLFEGDKTFNLLALANVTEVFSVTEVPAGTYDKIRLTLTQIELVFHDGRPPEYPSLPGNGKLDINPQGDLLVDADNPLTVELDFDAEKSLHVVGNGNDRFNFRPVVLTRQVENEFDTKLIRQTGVVRNLDADAGSFDLCLIDEETGDDDDCVGVLIDGAGTSLFGSDGGAIGAADLDDGGVVTVVGRFYMNDALVAASAGSGFSLKRTSSSLAALEDEPLCEEVEEVLVCGDLVCEEVEGQLICDEELVCDDIEGELVCEEIGEEEPLCEEIDGQLICDGLECEPFEGELLCDGNLFCNDIEGEFVCEEIEIEEQPEECFEFAGELVCEDDCEVIDEELVCGDDDVSEDDDSSDDAIFDDDESEDDISEDDESEDDLSQDDDTGDDDISEDDESGDDNADNDMSEDDESEDDTSENDTSEDEEESDNGARVVLLADIIWLGDDFSRTENVACGPVTKDDVLGARYQNAELDGEDIVLCDDENSRTTTLLPGARIYDRAGNPLSASAIAEGVVNVVDGFITDAGLQAVLVIVEPSGDGEERTQLSGTIGILEGASLSLITDLGDRCVVFDDSTTDVFVTGLDELNNIIFSESSAASLTPGQRADAFGEENSEGCLEADTLIIETE